MTRTGDALPPAQAATSVAVIGGGLAGITAALRCADAGLDVTLLEARPWLGGAAFSFQRGALTVDNGQHAVLRCYTAYRRLLSRLGVGDGLSLQDRFTVSLLAPERAPTVLRRARLPAPAHFAPALAAHRLLSTRQRMRVARTARALTRLDPDDPALDEHSFGSWLRRRAEPARAVEALWGLLTVAALNAHPDEASLSLAVRVFRTGMLDTADGGDIGLPTRPLGELHGTAAERALLAAGATVRLQAAATGLHRSGRSWQVAVRGGAPVEADAVVVAVAHQPAAALLGPLDVPGAEQWAGLSASPIVNVHVIYDRPVTELGFAAAVDSPVQWVFDRTAVAGAAGLDRGQYLAISLSAAHDYAAARTEDLRGEFLPALEALFPAARRAQVRDFFVTRQPRATFRQAPGTRALRPRPETGPAGLVLAGAWTATGWPDTMEGAVRSGETAADRVAGQRARPSASAVEVTA